MSGGRRSEIHCREEVAPRSPPALFESEISTHHPLYEGGIATPFSQNCSLPDDRSSGRAPEDASQPPVISSPWRCGRRRPTQRSLPGPSSAAPSSPPRSSWLGE